VSKAVADALPDGIEIELELKQCGLYAPKAKSYVLVSSEGKTSVKGYPKWIPLFCEFSG
jgi:hypothetical protein